MQISKKMMKLSMVGVIVLLAGGVGTTTAIRLNDRQSTTLASINRQCSRRLNSAGFGQAEIGSAHIKNETGKILVPCIVTIQDGANLQLTNVQLETKNFFLQSSERNTKPVHITVNKSRLYSKDGGIQVQLKSNGSSVAIKESSFNYPASIGIATGHGDDDTKAIIRATNSVFVSKSPDSEGIIMASTGKAYVNDNTFTFSDQESQAILLAADCQLANNINANQLCHVQ